MSGTLLRLFLLSTTILEEGNLWRLAPPTHLPGILMVRFPTPSQYIGKIYINLACLSVCLSVCLCPINVKTAEPIGPKFFLGHHATLGKVYE